MLASSAVRQSVAEQDNSSQQSSGRQECVPNLVRDYPQLRSELTDAVMADTSQFCPSLLEKLQALLILYHAIDLFFPMVGVSSASHVGDDVHQI